MTKLFCATCAASGRLPADLAGGAIRIGPASFDDPLAGACPEPHFAVGRQETVSGWLKTGFLGQAAGAAPWRRLAPAGAAVVPVLVTCKPPPQARVPVGATVSLAFIGRDVLVRRWEDGSAIVLKRVASGPAAGSGR